MTRVISLSLLLAPCVPVHASAFRVLRSANKGLGMEHSVSMDLGAMFARCLGTIFLSIAAIMLVHPQGNLGADGIEFEGMPVAGRAEIRAYYVGTAVALGSAMLRLETRAALEMIVTVLGAFAITRVVAYKLDGVDATTPLRRHQHAVFALEVVGTVTASLLLLRT